MRTESPRRAARIGVTVAALVVLAAPIPATADELSGPAFRALAERAVTDPAARSRLEQVTTVDGRAVDVRAALAGAQGRALADRLATLASATPAADGRPGGVVDPAAAARRILAGRRYRPPHEPRPLRGVLHRLGDWLAPIGRPFGRLADWLAGNLAARIVVLAGVAAAVAIAATLLGRRRSRATVERAGTTRIGRRQEDPATIERLADEAERGGRLDAAVRLRFRAGLLRLDGGGYIDLRPSLTDGALQRTLESPTLEELVTTFEEIAYGRRPAAGQDVVAAREGWPRVLQEVR